jgi:DNA-directed RNA polymerase specialized sigma24 family protein
MQHVWWNRQNQKLASKKMIDLRRSEIESLIDEWILNERDRKILKRRLLDGIKYEALASEFDMSVRQIKNIVYKGENRIFTKV